MDFKNIGEGPTHLIHLVEGFTDMNIGFKMQSSIFRDYFVIKSMIFFFKCYAFEDAVMKYTYILFLPTGSHALHILWLFCED